MKKYFDKVMKAGALALAGAAVLTGCFPETEDGSLGPLPSAAFQVSAISGMTNTYLLSATDDDAFLFYWDKGTGVYKEGSKQDTLYLPWAGDYAVGLRVLSSGGMSEGSQSVTVAEADPEACSGNLTLLTGCSSKTWILKQPDGGALTIGDVGLNTVWWSISAGDVTAADRVCLYDDEYTFTAEGGSFVFDDKGTFRVDDENSAPWPTDIGLNIGCYDTELIPAKYQAWASGDFKFEVSDTELTVVGLGAHLGLYKVGQDGTIAEPESSNTYQIYSLTEDELVVRKNYSWGTWQFTLIPK